MAGLSKKFVEEMKEQLLAQKEKIEGELSQFATRTGDSDDFKSTFPDYGNKDDENAEEVATYETNLRLEETLEKELRDISNSLKKMEDGTYGVCKYCKKPIPENRLRARPTSGSCVECKKTLTQEL